MISIPRDDESRLTSWFFETDRRLLGAVLIMVLLGAMFALSAGSVSAARIYQPWNYYLLKGIPFYISGLVILFGCSMLDKKWVMRASWADVALGLVLLMVTVVAPHTINGSNRWVSVGFNIMPADIMKPGFIFITAWFLAKMSDKYGDNVLFQRAAWQFKWLSWWPYLLVFVPVVFIIFKHPDIGTALLYTVVCGSMVFLTGVPLWLIPIGISGLLGMVTIGFFTTNHVHERVVSWWTKTGDRFQVDHSLESIRHGGMFGRGEDAFVKQDLPDAHTDFIFAAIVEDWGAIGGCILLLFLFWVLKRLVASAANARDQFVFYAAGGTAALFGAQICFNMLSTLDLFAAKGMTLPFISYGGSSLWGFCALFGLLLAVIREDKWK